MKKVILISLYIIVVGIIAVYFYKYITFKNAFDKAGIITIGKTLEITISKDDVRNYSFVENNKEFSKWNENEKSKFISCMKENKLTLKAGTYKINQGTTFEKAKEIFKFE